MQFRILGPVEVLVDGRAVSLGGPKQRLVLVNLLLRANRTVSTETLIDEIWGDDPPEAARNSLQSYISHLRKGLGEGRVAGGSGGYSLTAEPGEIDANEFESLAEHAAALARSDARAAVVAYRHALALWRGPPLADLAAEVSLAADIARLDERRLSTTEQMLAAEIDAGRSSEIVGDLEVLTSRHPLRESLWGQLMLALYRSGRQGDALATYERARRMLIDELGLSPSPQLQEMHLRILQQDPQLARPKPTAALSAAPVPASITPERTRPKHSLPEHIRRSSTHRRTRWLIAALAVVVVSATSIVVTGIVRRSSTHPFPAFAPGIALIDAANGGRVAFIGSDVVHTPVEAIFADGAYWVLNLDPLSFVEIDAKTGAVMRQIASPVDNPGGFAVSGNDLWVAHYTEPILSKVDIELGKEVQRVDDLPGNGGSGGVLVADGSVWVSRRDADDGLGILARLDPTTGKVQHEFHHLIGSYALTYGDDGAVWTAGTFGNVNRVDPQTNAVVATDVGGRNFYVTAGAGYGWTTDEAKGVVYQIDRAGAIVNTYSTGAGARSAAFNAGVVWVANTDAGTVSAVDSATGATRSYLFDHPLNAVASGAGTVLVEVAPGQPFDGRISGLDGRVAKLFVGLYDLSPLDPALLDSNLGHEIEFATCAELLRHPDTTVDGQLQPEIAAAMPDVSSDRLTYTFTIRPGFRFSPPSGEEVTAETIRNSIERALSPRLGTDAPAAQLVDDIEGASAFRAGTTEHISGLKVAADTLAITLTAPSTNFLERLTSPYVCPVPLGTPAVAGGSGVAIPTGQATNEFVVPSDGPYYIAQHADGEYTVLLRNPNYTASRAHIFDAIVLREGIDLEQARALVTRGEWDGIVQLVDRQNHVNAEPGNTISCLQYPSHGAGLDLAVMCPASPDGPRPP